MAIKDDLQVIYFTEEQIENRIKELGLEITEDYKDRNLIIITLLKGAAPFSCELMKNIDCYLRTDYLIASSYGGNTYSSGDINIVKDISIDIANKDVLLVDDILDTGYTLEYVKELLANKGPKSLKLCVLLDKPERRKTRIKADYCGFTIPDEFVVGYGLDYNQLYRNLPYIGVLKEEIYKD